jgi:uncharacterized protein
MQSFILRAALADAPLVLLAHGAGAPMDSPFLETVSELLVGLGIAVARFEFDYMAARRRGGGRKPPPKMSVLTTEYTHAIHALRLRHPDAPIIIGGKSMGGRVASMIADQTFGQGLIKGCVCLGYPLHPQGKPEQLRTAHLMDMRCPLLMVQGVRDALGSREEILAQRISGSVRYAWIVDGDHDLKPRKSSGATTTDNLTAAAEAIVAFVRSVA